jgi:hypothetical protein
MRRLSQFKSRDSLPDGSLWLPSELTRGWHRLSFCSNQPSVIPSGRDPEGKDPRYLIWHNCNGGQLEASASQVWGKGTNAGYSWRGEGTHFSSRGQAVKIAVGQYLGSPRILERTRAPVHVEHFRFQMAFQSQAIYQSRYRVVFDRAQTRYSEKNYTEKTFTGDGMKSAPGAKQPSRDFFLHVRGQPSFLALALGTDPTSRRENTVWPFSRIQKRSNK